MQSIKPFKPQYDFKIVDFADIFSFLCSNIPKVYHELIEF